MNARACILAGIAVFSLVVAAEGETPAPPDIHDPKAMSILVKDLASSDFATREDAQRRLDRIGRDGKLLLEQFANSTGDAEIASRLRKKIDALDELILTDPPHISLDIKDERLASVITALTKQMGVEIGPGTARGYTDTFTLQAQDLTFPEVLARLNNQHAVNEIATASSITLEQMAEIPNAVPEQFVAWRGFGVNLRAIKQVPAGLPRFRGGAPAPQYGFNLTLMADPRIKVARVYEPVITATDELKNLWVTNASGSMELKFGGPSPTRVPTIQIHFDPLANGGKTFTLFSGHVTASITLQEQRLVMDNPSAQLNQPVTIGDTEVTIVDLSPPSAAAIAAFTGPGANMPKTHFEYAFGPMPNHDNGAAARHGAAALTLLDGAGKVVTTIVIPPNITSKQSITLPNSHAPLSIVITAPTKTREVVVPFEFKNVPIPIP